MYLFIGKFQQYRNKKADVTNIGFQLKFQITFYDRIRSVLSYLAYFLEFFFFDDLDLSSVNGDQTFRSEL